MGNVELLRNALLFAGSVNAETSIVVDCINTGAPSIQLFCSFADFQCIAEELGVRVLVGKNNSHYFHYEVGEKTILVLTLGKEEDKKDVG